MLYNFNAAQVNPDQREVLPLDWYPVTITSDEWTENNNKNGHYLRFMLKVAPNHPRAGATQKDDMNLDNPSQEAVRIAHQRLSAYCHVTGILQMQDTRQLYNILFQAQIGPQKDNAMYGQVIALRYADGRTLSGQPGAALPAPVAVAGPAFGAPSAAPQQWGAPQPQFVPAPPPGAAFAPPSPYPVQSYPVPASPAFGGPPVSPNPTPVPFVANGQQSMPTGYAPSAPMMPYPSNGPVSVASTQAPQVGWQQQPPQQGAAPWKG